MREGREKMEERFSGEAAKQVIFGSARSRDFEYLKIKTHGLTLSVPGGTATWACARSQRANGRRNNAHARSLFI